MSPFEQNVKEIYQQQGWQVLSKGWPDFLLFKINNGKPEIIFVEVKSLSDELKLHQHILLDCLAQFLTVKILREEPNGTLVENPYLPDCGECGYGSKVLAICQGENNGWA